MARLERWDDLRWMLFAVIVALPTYSVAQEIGFTDLTQVTARTDLRKPTTARNDEASGVRGGMDSTYICGPSTDKQAGALRITLVSLDRHEYEVGDRPKFEVLIENVGSVPIKLPFSPHLADLQPADAGAKFAYAKLIVELWIGGTHWSANTGGADVLFGADDHPGTMLTLQHGESARILAEGRITLPEDFQNLTHGLDMVSKAYARVSISNAETLVTPTASATVSRGVCPSQTQGESLPIELTDVKNSAVQE